MLRNISLNIADFVFMKKFENIIQLHLIISTFLNFNKKKTAVALLYVT